MVNLSGTATNVPDRVANSHRKTSPLRQVPYATNTVALEEQLVGSRIYRKSYPHPKVTPPSPKMVAPGRKRTSRPATTPPQSCSANFYRPIKRRVGCSFRGTHRKGNMIPSRKQIAQKLPGIKGGLLGPKRFPRLLLKQDSSCTNQQHQDFQDFCFNNYLVVLVPTSNTMVVAYKKVGLTVWPSVENPDLMFQKTGYSQSSTHSKPAECGSRQAIQARPDHPDRVVFPFRGLPVNMQQVVPTLDLFAITRFNNKLTLFVSHASDQGRIQPLSKVGVHIK